METNMLPFPEQEPLRRWHDSPDVGPPVSASWMAPCFNQGGGNTWSKRMAASNTDSDSWEVRAFAEDANTSGQWPPRSYSCSYCQRDFRTAQALGGHMNVHRRERAQANQLAQRRSTGTEAPTASSAWLPRTYSQEIQAGDNKRAYDHPHAPSGVDSLNPSNGGSSFRNSSYGSTPWRSYSLPYESSCDSGLDLELRLGQRYD